MSRRRPKAKDIPPDSSSSLSSPPSSNDSDAPLVKRSKKATPAAQSTKPPTTQPVPTLTPATSTVPQSSSTQQARQHTTPATKSKGSSSPSKRPHPPTDSDDSDEPIRQPAKRVAREADDKSRGPSKWLPLPDDYDSDEPIFRRRDDASRTISKATKGRREAPTVKVLAPLDIEGDEELRNVDKWEKVKDNVFVKAGSNAQFVLDFTASAQYLQRYASGPKFGKRSVRVEKVVTANTGAYASWRPVFVSGKNDSSFSSKGISIGILQEFYTKAQYEAVRDAIIKILDRLPLIIDDKWAKSRALQTLLINIATEIALPGHTLKRNAIAYTAPAKRKSVVGAKGSYGGWIWFVNEANGEPTQYFLHVPILDDPKLIDRIPKVPDTIIFGDRADMGEQPDPDDPDEKRCHNASLAWGKFLSWKLTARWGSESSIDQLRRAYDQAMGFTRRKGGSRAFYKGQKICTIQYDAMRSVKFVGKSTTRIRTQGNEIGSCRIVPSPSVKNDVTGTLPDISLKSALDARVAYVVKQMHETWVASQDIKATWAAGLRAGDRVNEGSSEETYGSACSCDEEISKSTLHLCDKCFKPTLCSELSYHTNKTHSRWCTNCEQSFLDQFKDTEANPSLRRMRRCLKGMIKHDEEKRALHTVKAEGGTGKKARSDPTAYQKQLDEAIAAIEAFIHDQAKFSWYDGYSTKLRIDTVLNHLKRGRYVDPFLPSIESVLPYVAWALGYHRHVGPNLAVTGAYLNFGKSLFPPAVLGLIGEYVNTGRTDVDKQALIRDMDVLHEITMKIPYVKGTRLNATFDAEKAEHDRNEWIEVVLLPSKNHPWQPDLWKLGGKVKQIAYDNKDWRPPGHSRIMTVVGEIEEMFATTVPRINECPMFLHPAGVPEAWNWRTIDSVETIFLECIWQVLDPVFQDLFGLPITAWVRHPLRFGLYHLVHGRQMRTRWTNRAPTSINDRDDSLNNIIIESAFTNYAKSNVPNHRYGELQEDIKSIKIRDEWFKRTERTGTRVQAEADEEEEELNEDPDETDSEDEIDAEAFNAEESDDGSEEEPTAGSGKGKAKAKPPSETKKPRKKSSTTATTAAETTGSSRKTAFGAKTKTASTGKGKKTSSLTIEQDDDDEPPSLAETDRETADLDGDVGGRAQNLIESINDGIHPIDIPIQQHGNEDEARQALIAQDLQERLRGLVERARPMDAAERAVIREALHILGEDPMG